MKLFQGFSLAFNMLTIIPFFKVHTFFKGINGYSAMFYPLIGFLLGTLLWISSLLLENLFPPTHLAVILFSISIIITGALHIDGLSDTIDGLFVKKEIALEIMKEPTVGGMGMTFSFVFLILKLSSLIHFELYHLLPIILMLSRLNALIAIFFYPYISSGVGQLIKEELKGSYLLFALLYSLLLSYLFSTVWVLLLSLFIPIIIAKFFVKRLGGLNGDIYGTIIEVSELLLLNFFLLSLS